MERQQFRQIAGAWNPIFRAFVLRILQEMNQQVVGPVGLPVYEGNQLAVTHESDIATTDFQRVAGYYNLPIEIVRTTDISAFLAALRSGAIEMSRDQLRVFTSQLSEILEKAGRSFDNGGQPLTWERFLEHLDRLDFSFDENGDWQPPKIIVSEELAPVVQRIYDERLNDSEKQRQLDELVLRKRDAWNDREAHRQLVD